MTIAAQVSDAAVSAAVQGAQEEDEEGGGQFPAAGYHPSQNYQMRQQGVMTWSGGANNSMQQGQQRQTDGGGAHGSGGGGNRGPVSASLPESPNNPRVTPASVRWFHPHDAQLGAPSPAVGGFGRGVARSMSLEGPARSPPLSTQRAHQAHQWQDAARIIMGCRWRLRLPHGPQRHYLRTRRQWSKGSQTSRESRRAFERSATIYYSLSRHWHVSASRPRRPPQPPLPQQHRRRRRHRRPSIRARFRNPRGA